METETQLPTQITTWMHRHVPARDASDETAGDHAQFLYALRDTAAGDRQVVWEGRSRRGLVAVVDFGDPKLRVKSRWYSWGVMTLLEHPLSLDDLRSDPVLANRFSPHGMKALQGLPTRLTEAEGAAIDRLAGGLPAQSLPQRPPRAGEPVEQWFGSIELDLEKEFELAVYSSKHLWKRIGFPRPPLMQQLLRDMRGRVTFPILKPDLISRGVVGEVKRSITPIDGPAQLARYLQRLEDTRSPEGPWRGKLIHAEEVLSDAVRQRLDEIRLPIVVWAVVPARFREWKVIRQYPR